MLLSKETTIHFNDKEANIISHMCYAAYKLWNVCNYERKNYKDLIQKGELKEYPDWYYQKSAHKDDIWFKSLPSQTAQEVCKLLDKGWKSFYKLLKTKGIENPQPPKFKHELIPITYMQNGIQKQENGSIRLSISKQLKEHMSQSYGIKEDYIFIHNQFMNNFENIKQIKIYPPKNETSRIIVIYEIEDTNMLLDNFHYLSIDLGLHNLFTCYDSLNGNSFIVGRKYLSICRKYDKAISRVQSEWYFIQNAINQNKEKPVNPFYPKSSNHIKKLYEKKQNCINDYLHKTTKSIVDYCVANNIHTVVIGDIKGIRKNANLGSVTNQKLHSLPSAKIYQMLEYKLNLKGISLIKQKENYSSQCSPNSKEVSKKYATKKNRIKRGLYQDGQETWNADAVGAYNILRLSSQCGLTSFTKNKIEPTYVMQVRL